MKKRVISILTLLALTNFAYSQNCDKLELENKKLKTELRTLKKEYGVTEIPSKVSVKSTDPEISFLIKSIEGDKDNQTVTVNFQLYTKKVHQSVKFWVSDYGSKTKAYDNNGNTYKIVRATIGDKSGQYNIANKLPTEIRVNCSITFANVLPTIKTLKMIELGMTNKNYATYDNTFEGMVEISNLSINWK